MNSRNGWRDLTGINDDNFFFKLLMYIFKLLIQIQISLSIGNLYLADKVTHIVNKFIQKKKKKLHLGIQVHTQ